MHAVATEKNLKSQNRVSPRPLKILGGGPIATSIHSEELIEQSPKPLTQISFTSDAVLPQKHSSLPSLCDHLDPELRFPESLALFGGIKRAFPVLTRPLDPEKAEWELVTIAPQRGKVSDLSSYGMRAMNEFDRCLFMGETETDANFLRAWYEMGNTVMEAPGVQTNEYEFDVENLQIFLPNEHALAWLALKYQNSYQISLSVIHFEDLEARLIYERDNAKNPYFGLFVLCEGLKEDWILGIPLLFYRNSRYMSLECCFLGNKIDSNILQILKSYCDSQSILRGEISHFTHFTSHAIDLFTLLAHALIDLKARPRTLHKALTLELFQQFFQSHGSISSGRLPSEWTFGQELDIPGHIQDPEVSLPIISELTRGQLREKYTKRFVCTASRIYTIPSIIPLDQSRVLRALYTDFSKKNTIPLPRGLTVSWDEKARAVRISHIFTQSINTYSYALAKAHFEIFFNERYQAIILSQIPLLEPMYRLITHYLHEPMQRRI